MKKHVIGALPGAITGGLTETDFTWKCFVESTFQRTLRFYYDE